MRKSILFSFLALSLALISCNGNGNSGSTASSESSNPAAALAGEITIVYINTDSLISSYDLFKEMRDAYEIKANKAQTELERKGQSFERDMMQFQEQIQKGLITRAQAAEKEQNLQRAQQSLIQYRDNVMEELAEEEQVMLNNINHNIREYIEEYNKEKNYTLILSTNAMTNTVLIGHPAMDITQEVIEGINRKYASEK